MRSRGNEKFGVRLGVTSNTRQKFIWHTCSSNLYLHGNTQGIFKHISLAPDLWVWRRWFHLKSLWNMWCRRIAICRSVWTCPWCVAWSLAVRIWLGEIRRAVGMQLCHVPCGSGKFCCFQILYRLSYGTAAWLFCSCIRYNSFILAYLKAASSGNSHLFTAASASKWFEGK